MGVTEKRYESAEYARLEIRIDARESECIACGVGLVDCRKGFAMIEGEILAADDPRTDWGGFDACDECFKAWEDGGPAAVDARVEALEAAKRARDTVEPANDSHRSEQFARARTRELEGPDE